MIDFREKGWGSCRGVGCVVLYCGDDDGERKEGFGSAIAYTAHESRTLSAHLGKYQFGLEEVFVIEKDSLSRHACEVLGRRSLYYFLPFEPSFSCGGLVLEYYRK